MLAYRCIASRAGGCARVTIIHYRRAAEDAALAAVG
jgi:hypothetical protein